VRKFLPHSYHIWAENGSNFRTQYKSIQNLKTSQGYIFRISQHFATKLCKFTNFSILSSCGDLFASPCLVLKLVYNENCLFTLHQATNIHKYHTIAITYEEVRNFVVLERVNYPKRTTNKIDSINHNS
jgi:hypothetical protein